MSQIPTPGLIYALTNPKPHLSESDFNKWYTEAHIKDVVDSGLADLAIRYKNTNTSSKYQYLSVYRVLDMSKLQDQKLIESIPKTHELLPDGKEWSEVIEHDIRAYVLLQKFEGVGEHQGPRGQYLRTIMIEPAEGGDSELDEWYRKQHLDMLSMCNGYRRCTRYVLPPGAEKLEGSTDTLPRYLACHEYDTPNLPKDQLKVVVGTEWSKKIIGNAKKFEGEVWEAIPGAVYGSGDAPNSKF